VTLGLERLLADPVPVQGARVGLVANASAVDRDFTHALELLFAHPHIDLVALFAPEHGFRGALQAGEGVATGRDAATGLVVYSLYGETRRPTAAMLEGVDVLLFDIQDVGTRFYTYISTLRYLLEEAARHGKRLVVLDRPNPLGGKPEGPLLDERYRSFVGADRLPLRHGMTVGELARYFNRDIGAELTVVPMTDYRRELAFAETGAPWVMPSPNMPTLETALVYPGTALLEASNVSEGRGTTRPFELVGAPFIDAQRLAAHLNAKALPGVRFRAAQFVPTFSKYAGERVEGVQLHVTDPGAFEPVRTGLEVIASLRALYPDAFAIDRPQHFDALVGNGWVREALERGDEVDAVVRRWQAELEAFAVERKGYLLYD
jgi:uncharacterized protein YbbC (DUF1343 family)